MNNVRNLMVGFAAVLATGETCSTKGSSRQEMEDQDESKTADRE